MKEEGGEGRKEIVRTSARARQGSRLVLDGSRLALHCNGRGSTSRSPSRFLGVLLGLEGLHGRSGEIGAPRREKANLQQAIEQI